MKTKAKCLSNNSEISPAWFESSFGTKINIEDENESYPQVCFNYIHQNPINARLVQHSMAWEFSSYLDYVGIRDGKLINRNRAAEFGLKIF